MFQYACLFVCLFVLMQVGLWMEKGPLDYSLGRNYIYPAMSYNIMLKTNIVTLPLLYYGKQQLKYLVLDL